MFALKPDFSAAHSDPIKLSWPILTHFVSCRSEFCFWDYKSSMLDVNSHYILQRKEKQNEGYRLYIMTGIQKENWTSNRFTLPSSWKVVSWIIVLCLKIFKNCFKWANKKKIGATKNRKVYICFVCLWNLK